MSDPTAPLETDTLLLAVRAALLAPESDALKKLPEAVEANIIIWHHGVTDPDDDIQVAIGKSQGVSFLVYDLGGDESGNEDDVITGTVIVELYVDTTKRNRRVHPEYRLGGQIRDAVMRKLHRHPLLTNTDAWARVRTRGYAPLADPEFAAWRITLTRNFYL